jgi:hypothetical protein
MDEEAPNDESSECTNLKYAPPSHIHPLCFFTLCLLLELNGVGACVWILDSFEIVDTHSEAPQHRIPQIFQLCCHT